MTQTRTYTRKNDPKESGIYLVWGKEGRESGLPYVARWDNEKWLSVRTPSVPSYANHEAQVSKGLICDWEGPLVLLQNSQGQPCVPMDRIPASDRVMLATRTEAPITPELAERFAQVKSLRLLHVSMGLVTEAGEFMDMLKKHFFYGKPIDEVNAAEELGDLDWYMNLCCSILHTTMAIIEVANIRKLATRYGDKFSEDKALLRNLSLELEGLQKDLSK